MNYPKKLNLILLPGLDGTGILFQPLVEQLRDIFHVTVIAYPKDRPSSLPEMAEIVKEQLSTPEDTILLAESFSGLVALTILEQCAIPLRGIIFCAAFAESPRPFLLNCLTMLPVGLLLFPWIPGIFYRVLCLGLSANPLLVKNLQGVLANVPSHVLVHRLRLILSSPRKLSLVAEKRVIDQGDGECLRMPKCRHVYNHIFLVFDIIL